MRDGRWEMEEGRKEKEVKDTQLHQSAGNNRNKREKRVEGYPTAPTL